ncbi:chromosome segregation protein SMC [Schaalia sp. ZJ405]|uniref:chromosome segregation protein SMC n=1 Tax=Schaalia sp. ZJ405 TaxID=2709403 RepID=UPI0013EDC942|nr:chromosome segregation protein SMC [Schaalia sp. ZJ405]QPK81969.1 chromosome segregation protein SMC [Schaalia sp. ZJ405]
MHLKTLTLRGFKSFASATTLRLEPGITCVVGPNGSGKSNVVDALAWVMGEQGAKTLRGGQMADVIFAGTSGRPALGRAQVDLTIDNTDGVLDVDYSEVTISRTLFRGGGSEYQINGTPARLLDVQELLSDTGMGRQMHVIVGQGQLDAILSSTPEDRRGFIEEAAGVLKHRRRKERALRKLADMDQNLVRVLDLTNEIHRQLGPLARQAKVARRATLIQARVRDASARILADDLVAARDRLAAQTESDRALLHRQDALQRRIADARARLAQLEAHELESTPRVEQAMKLWQELTTLHERLRGTQMAAQERVMIHSTLPLPPTGDDPEVLEERARAASDEDALLVARVEDARTVLANHTHERHECEDRDQQAARELARVNRVLADHRERVARLSGDVSSASSRVEAAKNESERAQTAYDEARERLALAENTLAKHISDVDDEVAPESNASAAHSRAVAEREDARARVSELLDAERDARSDRATWLARRDTLEQSLIPEDTTRELLGRHGVLGELSSRVSVSSGYEDAAAAVLAPFTGAVVVASLNDALKELQRVKSLGNGLVRMVIAADASVESDAKAQRGDPGPVLVPLPPGATWMRDVVTIAPDVDFADLIEATVVVEDAELISPVMAIPGVEAVVTLRGDVYRSGRLSGTGAESRSILALRAQYEEAGVRANEAQGRFDAIQRELAAANEHLDRCVKAANDALTALRAEDALRAQEAQERARAQSAVAAARAEAERAQANLQRSRDQVEWAQQQEVEAKNRMNDSTQSAPEEDLDAAQKHADEASAAAREARETETRLRLELRAIEEESRQVQARARSLRQAAAKEREARTRFARQEAVRVRELRKAQGVAEAAAMAVDVAARALAEADAEREEAQKERSEVSQSVTQARKEIDAMNSELGQLLSASHRDEIAREQTRMRVEQLEMKAMEELSLEAEQLVEEFGPHNLVPVFPRDVESPDEEVEATEFCPFVRQEQERALEKASRDLERLGRVNPLALEEHEAAKQRHDFLVSQVQDLKKSKADLLRIIEDVDRLVEEAFESAFADTRREFAHTFEVLFPGGQGDLVLTDPENMLTTGIEIEARPAGKKVKRLSLLSGGERSLAAIAFLVAIFKARPSPFYVMDEVEAALDDMNLSRLLEIFKELREESQLIVITHQKRTMEIADALYGVTMRDGVTTVVSQKLA